MKNFFLGFIIGIGKVLPGVSGSLLAIRFNLYEKIIDSITNYFKNIKWNTLFLMPIFLGVILAIVLFSRIILFFLNHYHFVTILIFILLIITGIPDIYKKGGNLFLTFISFFLSFLLLNFPFKINVGYFFMGIIEAISIIIPGISGTAIYISLGVYEKVLNLYTSVNINNWFFFFLGLSICSLLIIKIIDYLFKKHKKETYSLILGFLISSIISMITC